MATVLKEGFRFYQEHFGKIVLINVTLVFPLLVPGAREEVSGQEWRSTQLVEVLTQKSSRPHVLIYWGVFIVTADAESLDIVGSLLHFPNTYFILLIFRRFGPCFEKRKKPFFLIWYEFACFRTPSGSEPKLPCPEKSRRSISNKITCQTPKKPVKSTPR